MEEVADCFCKSVSVPWVFSSVRRYGVGLLDLLLTLQ